MTRAERDRTAGAEAPSSASPVVAADAAQPDGAAGAAQPDGAAGAAQPDGAAGAAQPDVAAGAAQPDVTASRRPPTALEAKALAHVLRQRILRLCAYQELTNKELADQLDSDPGTVLYHVRLLLKAGLLEQAPVRTGASGALEKPYRSTGRTWWLDNPLADASPDLRYAPVQATLEEVRADPDSVATFATFLLHLSEDDVKELDRRLLEVVDSFVRTDPERLDRPAHRGAFVVHRLTAPD